MHSGIGVLCALNHGKRAPALIPTPNRANDDDHMFSAYLALAVI